MDPRSAGRLPALFKAALGLAPNERATFLAEACADDPALRGELEGLLDADAAVQQNGFLAAPVAIGLEPTLDPETSREGERIGAYTLIRQIGRGGMGAVYLARRDDIDKKVAVKLLRAALPTSGAIERFLLERRVLARLEHPNIARLLDAGMTPSGAPYFAMEYVDGLPLTEFCERHKLNLSQRLELIAKVCEAVQYANQNLIIHRDLKPQNILVNAEGVPKLLDFGIAKLLEEDESDLTRTGHRIMTPQYAAPEQIRGEPVTTATDVYALGLLLYELLASCRPYELKGCSLAEIENIVCEIEPVKPSLAVQSQDPVDARTASSSAATIVTDAHAAPGATTAWVFRRGPRAGLASPERRRLVQGDLDTICMKSLAKEPAQRYATAAQLLDDLRRHREGRPIWARPRTLGYRFRKFVRRHSWSVAASVLILASMAGGLGVALWQAELARRERDGAEKAQARAEVVSEFLVGLFKASDPESSRGEEVTARELLERGVTRAEELSEQPEARAQMLHVIGRVYNSLGQPSKAEPLLEQALALRRETLGTEHDDTASSLNDLGTLLAQRGEYEKAIAACRESLEIRRRILEQDDPKIVTSIGCVASVAFERGDYPEAERLHRQMLEADMRIFGAESLETANNLNNLAVVVRRQNRLDEAEELFRRALAIRRSLLTEPHPDLARSVNNLAGILKRRERYDEAERLYREALAMRRKLLGPEHWEVALTMGNLAALLRVQAKLAEAETLCRDALAMNRKHLGPDHYQVAFVASNLAGVLADTQEYVEAEALYQEALGIYKKRELADAHPEVQSVYRGLVDLYAELGDQSKLAQYQALVQKR